MSSEPLTYSADTEIEVPLNLVKVESADPCTMSETADIAMAGSADLVLVDSPNLVLTKAADFEVVGSAESNFIESDDSDMSVCSFFLEGKCRFGDTCFNLHPEDIVVQDKNSNPNKWKKKSDKHRKKGSEKEKEDVGKKPPMKTAGDVRKRIQWDPDLNKEHFTVGYLDRFLGIIEKPFTEFSWEHLAMVDWDQLAIPQHRIQYFCYRGTKVWDKNQRLDNVFGSVGSNITIQDVIQEVNENIERERLAYTASEFDSDSDDDVVIMTSDASAIKARVETRKEEFDQLRATHFLCIKVNNDDLKVKTLEVQESIYTAEPILRSCAMPTELLHVTLAMIRIDTPEAMTDVIALLEDVQPKLQAMVADPLQGKILVKGLSTFGARVLYTKLTVPEIFNDILTMMQRALEKINGLVITNHFDFVPHMTLLKVNRVIARERRSKYLNSILYNEFVDRDFGTIDVNNLNLCIIDDMRGNDGFYLTCKQITF